MTLENMAMAMGTNTASRSRDEIHCHTSKSKALCMYEYSVRRSANAAHQQRPNPATLLCQSVHQRTQWGLAVTCMLCAAHILLAFAFALFCLFSGRAITFEPMSGCVPSTSHQSGNRD